MFLTTDSKPVNSQAFASKLSSRRDNWSPITWYQPTADSTSDPVATGDSTGVSMATEVWSRTVTQSRSLLKCSTAGSYRRGKALRLCVCLCLSYVAMVIRSGQCQERLESRGQHSRIYIQKADNEQHKCESLQKYTSTVMTPLRADQKNTCQRGFFVCGVFLYPNRGKFVIMGCTNKQINLTMDYGKQVTILKGSVSSSK